MNKEFAPYEPSLDLKELGFNEPCFTWYWDDIGLYNGLEYGNHNKREHAVSAPTYSQAFRWFREKYGYLSFIDMDNYSYYRFNIYKGRGISEAPFETYEEAELACLKKLIEIVKTK
jgi:hypothetical protein